MQKTIHKLLHYLPLNYKKREYYKSLLASQYYSLEQMEQKQMEQLKRICLYSKENTSYYNLILEKFDFNQFSLNSFQSIPFLTKDIIKTRFNELVAPGIPANHKRLDSTSGSSGKKTNFFKYLRNKELIALDWRGISWLGGHLDDMEIRIWGAHSDIPAYKNLHEKIRSYLKNNLILSGNILDYQKCTEYVNIINKKKPERLAGYPSTLSFMAQTILNNNLQVHSPLYAVTSGEMLYPWQRDLIQKAFGCKVYGFYGCREVGMIAQQCSKQQGFHISVENIFLEVIDENGKPVFDTEGEIVVTDLNNLAFPLIRYKIGDRGILSSTKCECGISLPVLKEITGRTFDLVKTSDGAVVGPTFFTLLFRQKPGIFDFRIHQKFSAQITVFYISDLEHKPDLDYYKKEITKNTNGLLAADFVEVDSFPPVPSGKIQFIKSEL